MKFEFDSNNVHEVAAIHAATTQLLADHGLPFAETAPEVNQPLPEIHEAIDCTEEVKALLEANSEPELPPLDIELDTDGQPWDADLHASTKTKTQDGKWKKRRGATAAEEAAPIPTPPVPQAVVPPVPPAPAAEPKDRLVTMAEIWNLMPSGKATVTQVLAIAQSMGFSDLGALAQKSTNEQRTQIMMAVGAL